MTFPVYIGVGAFRVHPHFLFEAIGYVVGIAIFLRLRKRQGDPIPKRDRWSVVTAAVVGAAIGARFLFWLQEYATVAAQWRDPLAWPVGKTIVGGLIGGLIGVEFVKKRRGVTTATGDLFAIPVAIGIAIGRIGCFLTGLPDNTYGTPTSLPFGVDFGDGIPRHPTQLYEAAALLVLAAVIARVRGPRWQTGDRFRLFMVGYLGLRLAIDFIKPYPSLALGMSAIQWACLATLAYYVPTIARWAGPAPIAAAPTARDA